MNKDLFLKGVCEKYPEKLLEKRVEIEGNVIASIYKDPLLIDEIDLTKNAFLSKDGRFYYCLAVNLRKKNFNVFDEVTILSNSTDEVIERFNSKGGFEVIEHMTDIINLNNWDTYIDLLYRENILIKLFNDGFNLFNQIEYNKKNIIPIDVFRQMSSDDVIDFYETLLTNYGTGYSNKVFEEEEIDFEDDFLDQCVEGLDVGVSFGTAGYDINGEIINCFPFLSNQVMGLAPGYLSMCAGFSSTGKSTWWVTTIAALVSQGEKILIISNEERLIKFKVKFLVWILSKVFKYYKLTKKKILSGDITDETRIYYKKAQNYWRKNYRGNIKFIRIEGSDINLVKKKVRENVLKFGYTGFLYDTFKIQEKDMSNARQDLALVRDCRELDRLCKKYNILGMTSVQLAEHMKGRLFLDSSCLSNSKQVKEDLEALFMMRNVYDEELDPKSKYYCNPFRLKKVDDKWVEEPYECDRKRVWRAFFIEKARDGSNSSDTGVAYLLAFDGDHAIFRETCLARFKHGEIK